MHIPNGINVTTPQNFYTLCHAMMQNNSSTKYMYTEFQI